MFYVESLDRARRKRQVSKEIKVAAEENDFDVKNGVLYRLMYLQIFTVIYNNPMDNSYILSCKKFQ